MFTSISSIIILNELLQKTKINQNHSSEIVYDDSSYFIVRNFFETIEQYLLVATTLAANVYI